MTTTPYLLGSSTYDAMPTSQHVLHGTVCCNAVFVQRLSAGVGTWALDVAGEL